MTDSRGIKSVDINNFRVYNGNTTFKFNIDSDEVVDFAVIYAPNGSGKTSFFDAIEWTLTGEINRLEKDIGDKDYKGYILKNRNSNDDNGIVEITLDNDEKIQRKTRRLTEKIRHDYAKGIKTGQKEFFDYKNWDFLILPHNRIESFVKDNTGSKKYEYWSKFWDPTGVENKKLKFIYEMKNFANTELENIDLQIKQNNEKLEELEGTSQLIKSINSYIKKYNNLVTSKDKIKYLCANFNTLEYSNLINEIEYKKEILQKGILVSKNKLNDLELLKKEFIGEINENFIECQHYSYLLNSWSLIYSKGIEKLNYKNNIEKIDEKIKDNNYKLTCLNKISSEGEEWFKGYKQYLDTKTFINTMLEKRKELDEAIRYFDGQEKKLKNDYDEYKFKNDINKKLKDLNTYTIARKKFFSRSKINDSWIEKISQLRKHNSNLIKKTVFNKEQIEKFIINNLEKFNFEQIGTLRVEISDKIESINKLQNLLKAKHKIQESLLIQEGKYETAEKLVGDMKELILLAREYIKNNNSKSCPICNKEYGSVDELLSKTNLTGNDTVIKYYNELCKLKNQLKIIDAKTEFNIKKWNADIQLLINSKSAEIDKLEKNEYRIKLIEDSLNAKKINYKNKIEEYNNKIYDLGYKNINVSEELIQEWYIQESKKINKELESILKKIKCNKSERDKQQKQLENLKKEYDSKNQKRMSFESCAQNLENIEFLKYNNINFDLSSTLNQIKKTMDDNIILEETKNQINQKVKVLNFISIERIDYYQDKVNYYQDIFRRKKESFIEKHNKYINIIGTDIVKDKIIKNKKDKLLKRIQHNNFKLQLLSNINFNGEIQEYLKSKNEIQEKSKELSQKRIKCKKSKEKLEKIYTDSIKIIEEEIHITLNTPLINDFYMKIEPHPIMKKMKYSLKLFDNKNSKLDNNKKEYRPELEILVSNDKEQYLPDWYFSSAQLNVVALTTFLARANSVKESPINTILIDDPVGHFDEINIIAFVDLLRCMVEKNKKQIIISTHDEVVYNLLKRKLSPEFYSSKFIELGYRE